jgi:hypothetical protein
MTNTDSSSDLIDDDDEKDLTGLEKENAPETLIIEEFFEKIGTTMEKV